MQRDGLAGAGGAGHQTVAVGVARVEEDGLLALAEQDLGFAHVGFSSYRLPNSTPCARREDRGFKSEAPAALVISTWFGYIERHCSSEIRMALITIAKVHDIALAQVVRMKLESSTPS